MTMKMAMVVVTAVRMRRQLPPLRSTLFRVCKICCIMPRMKSSGVCAVSDIGPSTSWKQSASLMNWAVRNTCMSCEKFKIPSSCKKSCVNFAESAARWPIALHYFRCSRMLQSLSTSMCGTSHEGITIPMMNSETSKASRPRSTSKWETCSEVNFQPRLAGRTRCCLWRNSPVSAQHCRPISSTRWTNFGKKNRNERRWLRQQRRRKNEK
mmetsp:Transcript_333/g.769  ORF Transcript_333/g.769 Transcript_333/m.769 type:complete len:210 (-) Transcript_333:9-638(-)